ncbi:DNA helicase PcrA [Natronoglycomyces albus]|uniref:ATP-dependent DNA helicase n=1 Tax=Natronoglycomyces albus TaxID=2811108 RepID=A0A895XIG5_9ACTN|nr:DNA helicase PcrA [Natronoglycomyces albus]QSB04747.1 DNA helicase PcrA [Natronoglycomyces albus]
MTFGLEFDAGPDHTARTRFADGAPGSGPHALLEGLNEPQRQAVTHAGSPLLIVAGAGSGKTRVLTHRIAYLLDERHAHPGEILAITFTNKAAAEMRERVETLVGPRSRVMWVSTFHSACVRILRREAAHLGWKTNFTIYDSDDARRLLSQIVKDAGLDAKKNSPRWLAAEISNLKNELIDPEQAIAKADGAKATLVADIYSQYQQRLRQAEAVDFDDLIVETVHLFRAFPAVAQFYRRRFRHVLVDEYQDTNHAQYMLIRELVGHSGGEVEPAELCVVGDADQSIYAFRGATIRNILEFERDFPDAKCILLEQNYRSTQTILEAANKVIRHNGDRGREKNLWTAQDDGSRILGYAAENEHDEAGWIAKQIDDLTDSGKATFSQMAIFYRTNAQSRAFEEVFVRRGIPYKVVGGVRFYERKEVRDLLAYLKLTVNEDDTVAARRVINVPKRGIGDKAVSCVDVLADRESISFPAALRRVEEAIGVSPRAKGSIQKFNALLSEASALAADHPPEVVLEKIIADTGYLEGLADSRDPRDEGRIENVQELVSVAHEYTERTLANAELASAAERDSLSEDELAALDANSSEIEPTVAGFLEHVALVSDADQVPTAADEGGVVTLMTLHTAKGLEFDAVFLAGLDEGMFPHERSKANQKELEEERRLAYVGLTRARKYLHLTRASTRTIFGRPEFYTPSQFLREIPGELIEWDSPDPLSASKGIGSSALGVKTRTMASFGQPIVMKEPSDVPALDIGDRVSHDKFGLGHVVELKGSGPRAQARIDFGGGEPKWIILRVAPISKL